MLTSAFDFEQRECAIWYDRLFLFISLFKFFSLTRCSKSMLPEVSELALVFS
jgi:hypothetical protein